MEIGHIIPHIEALIFASEKPLTAMEITELINNAFGFMEDKLTLEQVQTAIDGIVEKYRAEFYPFEMRESGGGWQFLTKKDFHKTVAQLNGDKFLKRLSSAALETLAIIAYKQPVTKAEIEAIRGVSSDYAIQKLLEKELVMITGRNEKMPGHPLVYATSKNFMDYFGINSAEDLPKLKEVFDEAMVNPTIMNEEPQEDQPSVENAASQEAPGRAPLVVGPHGELMEGSRESGNEEENSGSENEVSGEVDNEEQYSGSGEHDETSDEADHEAHSGSADEEAQDDVEQDAEEDQPDEEENDDAADEENNANEDQEEDDEQDADDEDDNESDSEKGSSSR